MNRPSTSSSSSNSSTSRSGLGEAIDPVQRIADRTAAPFGVVRTFAKISAPENAHLFTAEAAHKAFAHLRKKA